MTGRIGRSVVAAIVAVGIITAGPAAAVDDGLRYETRTSYRVEIAAGVVRVTLEATVTNELAEYFFDAIPVAVLAEATNFAARTDDGRALTVRVDEADDDSFSTAVVDLDPVFFQQSETFTLTYDLPNQPPRSDGFTRVNDAFATFAAFTDGDENLAQVEILVPESFEVEWVGADIESTTRDGFQVLSSGVLAAPQEWFLAIVARNDGGLLSRPLDIDQRAVVLRAWPGDEEWADFVETNLREGIPTIERLIGQPWPSDDELAIIEAASPYVYGYAGWYLPYDNAIEIGDALDARVILHELSHLWFNDSLFDERWIGEAFAEEYAARTLAEMGEELPLPGPVDPSDPGAVALADWGQPSLLEVDIRERELYGYNASFFVLHNVVEEIGTDALRDVIAAATDEAIAYRGDVEPETVTEAVDSRRLLDLLEEIGGSQTAVELFDQYVLPADDVALLPERAAAREEYEELLDAGAGWAPPLAVRRAMGRWNFDRAETLIADAHRVLDDRDELDASAERLDLDVPSSLEEDYETSEELLDIVRTTADMLAAARAIEAADAAVHGDHGVRERVGLWGSRADDALHDARIAFEAANAAGAVRDANHAIDIVNDASSTGLKRMVTAAGVVVVLAILVYLGVTYLRRRPRSTAWE